MKDDDGARCCSLCRMCSLGRFLPKDDVRAFLIELVDAVRASADLGNVAAIAPVVAAWKGTAEIHSDPELLRAATTPLEGVDFGLVPDC